MEAKSYKNAVDNKKSKVKQTNSNELNVLMHANVALGTALRTLSKRLIESAEANDFDVNNSNHFMSGISSVLGALSLWSDVVSKLSTASSYFVKEK